MGIKNLSTLLKSYQNFPKKNISDIRLSIVAVDFSLFLYRFLYNQNNPIECFLRQIQLFFKNNILPVYVLDGNAPYEKNEILIKRATKRNKMTDELNKLIELKQRLMLDNASPRKLSILDQDIIKLEKKCVQFSREIISNLIHFFELCGIPVLLENYESDWILSQLSKNNLVDYVLSEDSDLLAFGSKKIMKNFCIQDETFYLYDIDKIKSSLNFDQDQFIDLCILSGCDYAPKLKNMNSARSYELINEFKKIENIENIPIKIDNVNLARNIFKKEGDKEFIDKLESKIYKGNFNFDEIENFLSFNLDNKYLLPLFLRTCKKFIHYKKINS